MSRIVWDKLPERIYETGIKHGVHYLRENGAYVHGVAWNGLVSLNETPSGAEANPFYADDMKYFNLVSAEDLGATLEAFHYPDQFAECDGSAEVVEGVHIGQQSRKMFGLCYRTTLGNPEKGTEYGYKLHLLYGCQASPSERTYDSINDSPEPATMSWEISTTPENVKGYKPTALMTLDSTKVDPAKMKQIEDILYGTDPTSEDADDGVEARMPLPDEIIEMLKAA